MTTNGFKVLLRAVAAALLMTVVAACSTVPGQSQTTSNGWHTRGWVDAATIPGGVLPDDTLISNEGAQGN